MKKNLHLFLIAAMLLISAFANAQTSGGPDTYGYTWRNNSDVAGPVYNWIDISARPGVVTVTGLADDNVSGPFPLINPFHYYWYDVSSFWIGSNGYIGFTSTPVASPFPVIPTAGGIQNWMACMTSDLTFVDNGGAPVPGASCQYWESTDTLIVTWTNVPFWDQNAPGYSGNNTFQLILAYADSSITYQYFDQTGASASTADYLAQGIENNSGSVGLEVAHDIYPLSNTAVKFYYPDTVTLAVNDASTDYINNDGTKGVILATNSSTFTSVANVKNAGNQTLASFNSYSRVVNSGNQIQVRDTVNVTNLAPGATQLITYPDTWSPTVAGLYRQINITIMTGDATPANDQQTLELWVVNPSLSSVSLQWDNNVAGGTGISWSGGSGGIAQHFVPPYYPCTITSVGCWIVSDADAVGYSLMVFADDGINGGPGTLLDSIYKAPGSFATGSFVATNTTTPIAINSGGFYVAWVMGGTSITLGESTTIPLSHQSYEILGAASNPLNWAPYRSNEVADPIVRAIIQGAVGTNDLNAPVLTGMNLYPNPANMKSMLHYNLTEAADMQVSLYTLQGTLVSEKNMGRQPAGEGSVDVYLQNVTPGVYLCKVKAGSVEYNQRITVIR
jgi:hypothetical protein